MGIDILDETNTIFNVCSKIECAKYLCMQGYKEILLPNCFISNSLASKGLNDSNSLKSVMNPISSNKSYLRDSLIYSEHGLLDIFNKVVKQNRKNSFFVFSIGRIFLPSNECGIETLALIAMGSKTKDQYFKVDSSHYTDINIKLLMIYHH